MSEIAREPNSFTVTHGVCADRNIKSLLARLEKICSALMFSDARVARFDASLLPVNVAVGPARVRLFIKMACVCRVALWEASGMVILGDEGRRHSTKSIEISRAEHSRHVRSEMSS